MNKKKQSFLAKDWVQMIFSSLLCILLGILVGYVVLLIINPAEASSALLAIFKNFLYFPRADVAMEYFGNTLARTAPLILCTLSILFAYKVGLFNIGASGQFSVGAGVALYLALKLHMPWYVCMVAAMLSGGIYGALAGVLKAYRNVNEVISCIMLNWISLYSVNLLLDQVKNPSTNFTLDLGINSPGAVIPSLGLSKLFSGNPNVTIAIVLAIVVAIFIWFLLNKTKLGYELKATGLNKHAAKYAGMNEKKNIVLTMFISGCLAGLAASFLFQSGIEMWDCTQNSVPILGFSGISAAFLGGLSPIGGIFSAFFIQHITMGGAYVDKSVYCAQITDLMTSIIIYFCAFVLFFKHYLKEYIQDRIDRKKQDRKGEV